MMCTTEMNLFYLAEMKYYYGQQGYKIIKKCYQKSYLRSAVYVGKYLKLPGGWTLRATLVSFSQP